MTHLSQQDPETRRGNILAATDVAAIVNPVNCLGVMGKGLARQFATRYPRIVAPYRRACQQREITTGRVQILRISQDSYPHYIVNLATKDDWRNPSRIQWVTSGLENMYHRLSRLNVDSVAIPPLGTGLGGLDFHKVYAVMERQARLNPHIRTVIYLPYERQIITERRPK